ncbi:PLP-dependent transferase [Colletotrichum zoysiae]|uniref:PLP-dependent transferase n=1 Tax=Colletotrichum zoysiae TaxID=1216348 RepID=A0AAD9LVF1_9PEZI|nr:PLP-dependent transferase [Colletotrichum zoysiae]
MSEATNDWGVQWRQEWADAQKIKGPSMKNKSVFYRNIEEELDLSRKAGLSFPIHLPNHMADVSSCDTLGMGHSGAIKEEFLKELQANPDYYIGATGSRLLDGTTNYQDSFEKELADLMGVESALVVHSGYTANSAIFSTVPRTGDVIVYDELMHATALSGMKISLALDQRPFRHNDVDHFIEVMEAVKESNALVRAGKRCVIVAVESYYSMDGDICPLRELIKAAKDVFPQGNAQFVVDEAHSFGACGPEGTGFVREQGLTDEVAITMATFTKALAGSGGESAREYLHELTLFYLDTLTSHPVYQKAYKKGLVAMPFHEDGAWHETPITHIVPFWTLRPRHALYLSFHLTRDGFNGTGIVFPIVPKGQERVRLVLHAHNTKDEVLRLTNSLATGMQELMDIEASGDKNRLPTAARLAFDLINSDRKVTNGTSSENTRGVSKDGSSLELNTGISAAKMASLVSGISHMETSSRVI